MSLYGLIGYPLSHSFSKKYFDKKIEEEGILNASFENFSIADIELLKGILERKELKGLAVTIPYKRAVIDFLDSYSEAVKQMQACNCIKVEEGRYVGFNTDVIGFEQSFVKLLKPQHKQALVLGTGGAASAVVYVLDKLGINWRYVSRTRNADNYTYEELNEEIIQSNTIIINASPVGTFPDVTACPAIPYQYLSDKHYLYDLVYNPPETTFLKKGKEKGAIIKNGYEMLQLQAEENWKIWNS